MIKTGIIRRIDELGRIVIEKSIRDQFGLEEGTPILIYLDKQGKIVLRKAKEGETGIIRKMDELGRIVIPKEMRDILNIKVKDKKNKIPGDSLEQFVLSNTIIIRKYEPFCIFCGSSKKIDIYRDKSICHKCMENISEKLMVDQDKKVKIIA